ncbi:DUF4350 domain-containing protein [Dokdonia sp. Hel_I_53]|uniref:DUF4350 domain-containing protein n=1 Tax=Dokdonia sp. Hel_I_53 TaxID=1566287 RepID=UPI00119A4A28|nr:DUF4350 domain-containing protein [Dokdonia sp. Hel_I_53]TVZ51123.1 uncharacterized protein DUF4350 [Dokdonia sp. Hel_I_53]
MSSKFKVITGFLLVAIALIIYMESGKEEPINWYSSYSKSDKIPFGTFVLHDVLKESRNSSSFKEVNRPPFEFLTDSSTQNGTYFFVNEYISFDEAEAKKLLSWVSKGNNLFIASRGIGSTILDTLNLETEVFYDYDNFERKPLVNLVNPELKRSIPYYLDIETLAGYFTEVDTLKTKVLGEFSFSKSKDTITVHQPEVNFVKQRFGKGDIFIHLMPSTFTNYFILRENNFTYTQDALSYINDDQTIFWDNHYKNGKTQYISPLYVFLNNRYLRWAYYMLIVSTLLWVIFEGRRKQRAIPIIKPLPNQTLAFTKTIAGMYLDKKDHKSITSHQINYFLEYIRSTYLLNTARINEEFILTLAVKSNNTVEETRSLVNYIVSLRNNENVSKEELLELNRRIEDFKILK